jgi:hypothetical protein
MHPCAARAGGVYNVPLGPCRTGLSGPDRSRRAGIAVAGLAIMPLATPALPLPALLGYQHAIDVRGVKIENHPVGLVPQQFADQARLEEA